jgi:hypothetical protein
MNCELISRADHSQVKEVSLLGFVNRASNKKNSPSNYSTATGMPLLFLTEIQRIIRCVSFSR